MRLGEAAASPDGRYGYLVATETGVSVRSEVDSTWQATVDTAPAAGPKRPAVSPNGRDVAYWFTANKVGPTFASELRLMQPIGTAPRSLLTVGTNALEGEVAWSRDGKGLVYTVESKPGSIRQLSELFVMDLPDGSARRIAGFGKNGLRPLVWDRERHGVAAILGDSYEYVHEDGTVETSSFRQGSVIYDSAVDPRHDRIAAIESYSCTTDETCQALRVWSPSAFSSGREVEIDRSDFVQGLSVDTASGDVLVLIRSARGVRLERWNPSSLRRAPIHTFDAGTVLTVRPDATAATLADLSGGSARAWLIDLSSDRVRETDWPAVSGLSLSSIALR